MPPLRRTAAGNPLLRRSARVSPALDPERRKVSRQLAGGGEVNIYEVLEMVNERARDYMNNGLSLETAQQQTAQDFRHLLIAGDIVPLRLPDYNRTGNPFKVLVEESQS
jgi:hypothetical protein